MTLPTVEHINGTLKVFFHTPVEDVLPIMREIGQLTAPSPEAWKFVTGMIAIRSAADARILDPRVAGGFYGVDPAAAGSGLPVEFIITNQLVAAAANEDLDILDDILTAHSTRALEDGPTSPAAGRCVSILYATLVVAYKGHQLLEHGARS